MLEEILKAIPVFLWSMLKFILGPSFGYAFKVHPLTTIIATVSGMMTSVVAFTYFGNWLKRNIFKNFFSEPQNPSKGRRRFILFIKKYGLAGIAFFTPLILTPIGGTILAVSMGKPREKILLFMLVSAIAWAVIFTFAIYSFGNAVLPDFIK